MYAPGYGFSNVPPNFNTGAPPPNQNPHMQPGSVPTQPGQQMMYNPNQFAGMPGGQPGFVGGPNPAMMSGAGPAGMMQNAGMPHMAANGQSELPPSLTCLSPPGSESREQERFSLLLEINQELLFESMQLQHTLSELKKETPGEGDQARKPTQEEGSVQQDYSHCMRRLQANLAYLAALADRKGNVQVPPSPAYLSSPPLNMALKIRNSTPPGDIPENNPDPMTDREERSKYLSELYRKLQALFPNADPKKEPPLQAAGRPQGQPGQQGQGQRPPSHHASPAMAQAQRPMQMQNMPGAHQQQGMSLS
ncbi:hypothetical protein CSIM01_06466 [Colletotrichum simmondsii]|uniref:Glutamine repeat protein-1 n=1 Tax=Colletotrichum simmondsii TaxID=703756 RepID=A0A135TGG0_9PEZI|nr:hypothetical protein CSIM01_06466 [Colletotrichum simmondsii]